jgi:HlyD family secretion protein
MLEQNFMQQEKKMEVKTLPNPEPPNPEPEIKPEPKVEIPEIKPDTTRLKTTELQGDPSEIDDYPPKPRRKWWLWLLILGLLGGGGYLSYNQFFAPKSGDSQRKSRQVSVKRANLPIVITANGTIQPETSINASPKTAGRLKALLVKEGESVEKGQTLAQMDDSNLQGQLIQLQAQVAAAKASAQAVITGNRSQDIAQAKANLENAIATAKQTEIIFRQNEKIFREGAISSRDYETSRTNFQASQARVRQFQQALSLQQVGSRPEEIARAQADVTAAEGSLLTVKTLINDTSIRAPFSGVVSKKFADPGAYVTPQTSGSSVSSATASSILALTSNNQVNAFVAETDIARVKVGQKISFKADAYPDQQFKGIVKSITPQATVTQNVTSFEVKSNILGQGKKLMQSGMNVSVSFNVGTLENVLVVPTVGIVRQKGMTGVYVKSDKSPEPEFIPIETGISGKNAKNRDVTEVKSGLTEGQEIYVSFPEGQRPRSKGQGVPGMPGSSPQRGSRG